MNGYKNNLFLIANQISYIMRLKKTNRDIFNKFHVIDSFDLE